MDFSKIRVPFIDKIEIEKRATAFRQKYRDTSIPVDIEHIIDVKLKVNIIPVPDLMRLCDTDALITSDWGSLYVDKRSFEDERQQNRLRFSFGHEVGHYILHRNLYSGFGVVEFEDIYKLIDEIPEEQYRRLEIQANFFSSYLLVPRDALLRETKNILQQIEKRNKLEELKVDSDMFISYLAIPVSQRFGVSSEVVEIILKNDFLSNKT